MSCWFFHKWTKWQLSHQMVYRVFQRRRCLRCGLYAQKELGASDGPDGLGLQIGEGPKLRFPVEAAQN